MLLAIFSSSNLVSAATDVEAHYRLDETSGTVAADSSGNGNNGTYVNGPTLGVAGVRGYAVELNMVDSDDRIDLPHTVLDGAMDASFAFWIKTTYTANTGVLAGANAAQNNAFIVLFVNSTNLRLYKGTSNVNVAIPAVSDNEWHHFVWTWDGDTNTAILYRNGLLVSSLVMGGSVGVPIDIDAGGLLLGQEQDCVGGCFNSSQTVQGSLDDVQIYRRVLNSAEVTAVYEGLIGHWKMDEGTGIVAADSSGLGHDASLSGATWTTQFPGTNALDFNGVGGIAQTDVVFDPPSEGSVAFWMRGSGTATSRQRVFGLNTNWEARLETNGRLKFDLGGSPFAGDEPFTTTTTVDEQGRWYHVVATFNAADDTFAVYVDGELQTSGTSPIDLAPQTAAILSFGTRTGSTEYWEGALRDFRIYSHQISAVEVSELYGLVGHWKMDEGIGTTAADSTAFGNDATLSGATWTTDCAGNNGLEFDGLGDTATTNSNFDPPRTGSVAFWLRSAGNPGSRSRPFGLGGNWEMRQESDGTLSFDLGGEGPDEGAGPDEFVTTEGLSFENLWYHVAANFDATDDSFEVYINGELVHSGTNGDDMVKQLANILTFGTQTGNTDYWKGALRDFRVYNRWLDASEVSRFYGLVGHWKLDETSGTVAVDATSFENDGTYTNGPLLNQSGTIDGAVQFDGTDDFVDLPDMDYDYSGGISVAFWVKPRVVQTNFVPFFALSNGTFNDDIWIGWDDDEGAEIFLSETVGGTPFIALVDSTLLSIGAWQHYAVTIDSAGDAKIYRNGALSASGNIGLPRSVPRTQNMIADSAWSSFYPPFDGTMDDVRLYNRTICSEEVQNLYSGGATPGVRIIQWVEVP